MGKSSKNCKGAKVLCTKIAGVITVNFKWQNVVKSGEKINICKGVSRIKILVQIWYHRIIINVVDVGRQIQKSRGIIFFRMGKNSSSGPRFLIK